MRSARYASCTMSSAACRTCRIEKGEHMGAGGICSKGRLGNAAGIKGARLVVSASLCRDAKQSEVIRVAPAPRQTVVPGHWPLNNDSKAAGLVRMALEPVAIDHPPAPGPAQEPGPSLNDGHMNESISEIQRLLQEIVGHLKSGTKADTRKVVAKLERIAALASTLALTVQARR